MRQFDEVFSISDVHLGGTAPHQMFGATEQLAGAIRGLRVLEILRRGGVGSLLPPLVHWSESSGGLRMEPDPA